MTSVQEATPSRIVSAALVTLVLVPACRAAPPDAAEELPPGVEQILPRGRIAAIFEPRFVPAAEAELPEDAWILGVEIGGQARAYSLNLLNRHEVVNDRAGGRSFAAVW